MPLRLKEESSEQETPAEHKSSSMAQTWLRSNYVNNMGNMYIQKTKMWGYCWFRKAARAFRCCPPRGLQQSGAHAPCHPPRAPSRPAPAGSGSQSRGTWGGEGLGVKMNVVEQLTQQSQKGPKPEESKFGEGCCCAECWWWNAQSWYEHKDQFPFLTHTHKCQSCKLMGWLSSLLC